MTPNARRVHIAWLRTHDALKEYTNGFTEPLQGKTHGWFLEGPHVSRIWVRNSRWAQTCLKPQYRKEVAAGMIYGKAFSELQEIAKQDIFPETRRTYEAACLLKNEIEKTEIDNQ